jgi:ABC-type transport system involved in cytochrome c biogenesis permease subunit
VKKALPWILAALCLVWAASGLFPRKARGFDVAAFGRLPVLLNGRIQPFDSVARNALLEIRTRQSVRTEHGQLPAMDWLLELMTQPKRADERKVFRIDNRDVLGLLKLSEEEKYFSFAEIEPHQADLSREGDRVQKIEAAARSSYERGVYKLASAMWMYQRLKATLQPPDATGFVADLEDYAASLAAGVRAVRAREAKEEYDQAAFDRLLGHLSVFDQMSRMSYVRIVPPSDPQVAPEGWDTVGAVLMSSMHGQAVPEAVMHYARMAGAYAAGDTTGFNAAVTAYADRLKASDAQALRKGSAEHAFNRAQLFYKSTVLYVLALLGALSFWFWWNEGLRRGGVWILGAAWVLHTVGLVWRMALEARPPVTNLYSSAIFIGWGAVLLGLLLERIYRDGIGIVVASLIGFATQIIAHNLAIGGDTMEMMRAVLDTNFWLATHVVTITLGYSAMFVAGALALIYILRGVFTASLKKSTADGLARMVYGIICFATLFSFVGTVLGGIWADQSWGRFWGWDPKENGALLIVLWCATMLHARWGGLIRARGLMNMAIVGNIITSFSWFGVNMLGIGLHSYGFMDSAFRWLILFIASQAAVILIGLLPLSMWKSFSRETPTVDGATSV